jgi:hypothetical protein
MPFQSDQQRKFMYAKHPQIAARWEKETPEGKKLPKKVSKVNYSHDAIAMASKMKS